MKKLNKKWIIEKRTQSKIIDQLLENRGIDKKAAKQFLNPDFVKGLHDPYLLPDMDQAVNRILKAQKNGEIVGIFGDYDADGIPAVAIINEILNKKLKIKTLQYIPTRAEGYGLNRNGIDYFKKNNVTLMITADIGIREIENIQYAKELGIDTIITDHHEAGKTIPKAVAVVNPKRKDSKYPFRELSGGAVAFKLIQALARQTKEISDTELKWLMDLVAITVICDVVPLIDENRIFAKFGLLVLAKTRRIGLTKLYNIAKIDPKSINTYVVGFQIGPRINAPGRLGEANESLKLLETENGDDASVLAHKLDELNIQRQKELERILREVKTRIIDQKLSHKKVICLSDKSWPAGLIGLVAGKITEEYIRPCLIFEEGEIYAKGSARSIEGMDLVQSLEKTKDILQNFGGHSKAAGLTIDKAKLEEFYDRMNLIADEVLNPDDMVQKVKIDIVLGFQEINFSLLSDIQKLEPFGLGNPRPVFALEKVKLDNVRTVGRENDHLSFRLGNIKGIAFGLGDLMDKVVDQEIDIAFTLDEDSWNGSKNLQLKVIDFKNVI